jgi:hypothetical protein
LDVVGTPEGALDGLSLGADVVGASDGALDGFHDGEFEGRLLGIRVGLFVALFVGDSEGALDVGWLVATSHVFVQLHSKACLSSHATMVLLGNIRPFLFGPPIKQSRQSNQYDSLRHSEWYISPGGSTGYSTGAQAPQ